MGENTDSNGLDFDLSSAHGCEENEKNNRRRSGRRNSAAQDRKRGRGAIYISVLF